MIAKRVTIAVATLAMVGCATPTEMPATPCDGGDQWNNRHLFDAPGAAIYASNPQAAREAESLIRAAAKRFTTDTGVDPQRGLVIVTDSDDELVTPDGKLLFTHGWRRAFVIAEKPAPDGRKLEQAWKRLLGWSTKTQIPTDDLLRHLPLPLDEPALRDRLQLPADIAESARWIVSVPTTSSLRAAARRMLPAFLKAAGIGPVARAVLAPFHRLIEAAGAAEYAKLREALIYAEFVTTHPSWSHEEKSRHVNAYLKAHKIKLFDRKKKATGSNKRTNTKHAP